jgi:hypothetical protein
MAFEIQERLPAWWKVLKEEVKGEVDGDGSQDELRKK